MTRRRDESSADHVTKVLRARAQLLSRPPADDAPANSLLEVLEFRLAQERYAVETRYLREVYPLKDLTPLPCTPPFVLGVVNVRGRILAVLDIRKFFNLPAQGLTDLHSIVIIHGHDMELGLLVDVVTGVRSIPAATLQPSLPALAGRRNEYLRGVTAERLVMLDPDRILSDPTIIVHEEVSG